jgi:hypothetical protein
MPDQDKQNSTTQESVKGSSSNTDSSGAATAPGRAQENQGSTGTEIQNPGTSRQDEDVTGDITERSNEGQSDTDDQTVRNPSGDDLRDAADGDEGSGKNF